MAKIPPTFYSSIDLRNSGFKIAPVDTNLFPAGFNNLNKDFEYLYITAIQNSLEKIYPQTSKILIVPEKHTRNKYYLDSLNMLKNLISKAGYEVRIGDFTDNEIINNKYKKNNSFLSYEGFQPEIIILNNDLSEGVPEILNNIVQPILPDKNMGWTRRSKTIHFEYYSDIVTNFSQLLDIDSWLLEPKFRNCGEIDFKTSKGKKCLIHYAKELFKIIQNKYDEYNIKEKPFIMIKADSGTYGMGIMRIDSIDDLENINRKQRNKMSIIKGGIKLDKVILQEGIYSYEQLKPLNHVAEPVIYAFGNNLLGGFYRLHKLKSNSENLNSPGMIFHPIPFEEACLSPNHNETINSDTNKFYVYGVVARLAILAASKEIYNLGD